MSNERTQTAAPQFEWKRHISERARNRLPSPLKALQRYWGRPGLISLAGGMPNPEYFPFSSVSADLLASDSFLSATNAGRSSSFQWFWDLFGSFKQTSPVVVPKYPQEPGDISLAAALQYTPATGLPALQKVVHEFTKKVYQPGYQDFATLVHTGNTDGWFKAVQTLCNPGEGVLTSEWTYPSAMMSMYPYGVRAVPIAMDGQGMRSDDLRRTLSGWDETARNRMRRPHVVYIVPTGQNPCGFTMSAARKQEIYDICMEYDVIIVEDDPYYFLQEGPYVPKAERDLGHANKCEADFITSLIPSFLRFDHQGRVIRLDTVSKTFAPGCRLGWFTCNPFFAERLERQSETSTQAPCGLAQSLVSLSLLTWRHDGYIMWLEGLRKEYTTRRNFLLDCLFDEFTVCLSARSECIWEGAEVYDAFEKHERGSWVYSEKDARKLFSFIPPTSGMFVWINIGLGEHQLSSADPEVTPEYKLWDALAQAGVLFAPGWIFTPDQKARPNQAHMRISFSNTEFSNMRKAISIFGRVLRKFLKVELAVE